MLDERTLIEIIAGSSQDECKQMGELFLSFADAPRDAQWRSQMRRTLAMYPEPPKTELSHAIGAARARVAADDDALFATGWHPLQMTAKLEEIGYTGVEPEPAVPLQ